MDKVEDIKGKWILGSIVMLLLTPVVFIAGMVVGKNVDGNISFSQDNLSSWVTAFATITIAVLTIVLAKETWALRIMQLSQIERIRKDSIKPSISFYLKSSEAEMSSFEVYIENNGKGVAQNVKFTFINLNEDAVDVFNEVVNEIDNLVILKEGILSLGPAENRKSFLFSFIELAGKFKEKTFECSMKVNIEFEDLEGGKYSSKTVIKFDEYKGISSIGGSPLHKISNQLEKIQKDIGMFASGHKRLKTDVYSSGDRKQAQEEREAHRERIEISRGKSS